MSPSAQRRTHALTILVLGVVYFLFAKLGLSLALVHANATAVWPPTGLAIGAMLLFGYRVWPGILLGAFFANVTTAGTIATSVAIATGNALEALAAAWLVNRFAGGRHAFDRVRDIVIFAVLGALLSTMISATIGVGSLLAARFAGWEQSTSIWMTWWLGDASGALVVAPLLIIWARAGIPQFSPKQWIEYGSILLIVGLMAKAVFGGWLPATLSNYPLAFTLLPPILWSAVRFGQLGATTATTVLAVIADTGALTGVGPFNVGDPNESLLLLQAFIGTAGVSGLVLAASISEQRSAEQALREAEHRFRALIEKSSDAISLITPEGVVMYASPSVQSILGYSPAEMVGSNGFAFVHPDDQDLAKHTLVRISQKTNVRYGEMVELRGRHADGSYRWLSCTFSNLLGDVRVRAVVINVRDITEHKQAEQQLQAALKEKETLLKEIHHRVKNNLQVVSSLLSLQANTIKDEELLELVRESQNRIRSMALIHESLYSTENFAVVDIQRYLRHLAGNLVRSYGARAQGIELVVDVESIGLNTDLAVPCGLIVTELISNAIKHGFADVQGGKLRLSLRRAPDGQLALQVSDSGCGLPPDVDIETAESLGLRLVNALAGQLGGRLIVERGLGTTVTITFPAPKNGAVSGMAPARVAQPAHA